jgi:hypothetical protein
MSGSIKNHTTIAARVTPLEALAQTLDRGSTLSAGAEIENARPTAAAEPIGTMLVR